MNKSSEDTSIKSIYNDLNLRAVIEVFLFVLVIVLFLKTFVLEFYRVESGSMEPELFKNDIVVVSRIAYSYGFPTRFPLLGTNFGLNYKIDYRSAGRGDIIVIDTKSVPNILKNEFVIKRVTAIPHDTILLTDAAHLNRFHVKSSSVLQDGLSEIIPYKGMQVLIDKKNIDFYESILLNEGKKNIIDSINNNKLEYYNLKVEDNYFFVQGDNVNKSYDSRAFGFIPSKAVVGRAVILLFSKDSKFRIL